MGPGTGVEQELQVFSVVLCIRQQRHGVAARAQDLETSWYDIHPGGGLSRLPCPCSCVQIRWTAQAHDSVA